MEPRAAAEPWNRTQGNGIKRFKGNIGFPRFPLARAENWRRPERCGNAPDRIRTCDLRFRRLENARLPEPFAAIVRQMCDLTVAVVSTEGQALDRLVRDQLARGLVRKAPLLQAAEKDSLSLCRKADHDRAQGIVVGLVASCEHADQLVYERVAHRAHALEVDQDIETARRKLLDLGSHLMRHWRGLGRRAACLQLHARAGA